MSISTQGASPKAHPIIFSGPMVRALLDGRKTQTRRIVKPQPYQSNLNPPHFSDLEEGDLFICPDLMPTNDQRGLVITECTGLGVYHSMGQKAFAEKHCPYGNVGDLLWVREAFTRNGFKIGEKVFYRADGESQFMGEMRESNGNITRYHTDHWERNGEKKKGGDWKPSIHMPRWASRLTLELTDVRVERLQDISEADAIAEGATSRPKCHGFGYQDNGWSMDWSEVGTPSRWGTDGILTEQDVCLGSPQTAFGAFINQLHGGKRWNCRPKAPIWDQNPWVWTLIFKVHQCNVDALLKREAA